MSLKYINRDRYNPKFFFLGFVGWEAQPIERDPTFFNRSYSSSTVYQDFEFLFGVVPGLEIKYLGLD